MSENPVIWRTNTNNEWGLYSNTDYTLPLISIENPDDSKPKLKPKTSNESAFYFNKTRQEIKGTIICTPKGYGIIQSINQDKKLVCVKVQGIVHEFDGNEIMNEIPINVTLFKGPSRTDETILLPVHSTAKDIYERMESSLPIGDVHYDIRLFSQGRELEKSDATIEKLKLLPLSKLLATYIPGKPFSVNRFQHVETGWSVGGNEIDGITFQVSKAIRITGFGMFPCVGGSGPVVGEAKLYRGDNTGSEVLWSTQVTLKANNEGSPKQTWRVNFDRPYLVKPEDSFSISLQFSGSYGDCYYGTQGQKKVTADGDVMFDFKSFQGGTNGTDINSGQVPEIYYYA